MCQVNKGSQNVFLGLLYYKNDLKFYLTLYPKAYYSVTFLAEFWIRRHQYSPLAPNFISFHDSDTSFILHICSALVMTLSYSSFFQSFILSMSISRNKNAQIKAIPFVCKIVMMYCFDFFNSATTWSSWVEPFPQLLLNSIYWHNVLLEIYLTFSNTSVELDAAW